MAHEGDARANTTGHVPTIRFSSRDARANTVRLVPIRFRRRPLPRPPLIPEQPPPTSSSAPSIVSTKKRKEVVVDFDEDDDEVEDWAAAAGVRAPPDVRAGAGRTVANVMVADADALECGVCFLALRPPIFQCEVGHVVGSACRDKLEATGNGKCHVCRRAATRDGGGGGYRRCHAMERLVDCIRAPCPYAAHGCHATPPYHGRESHRQACPHAPCHCPGASCRFIGSTATMLEHFAVAHNWPCDTKARASRETFSIRLRVGFNFFMLEDHGGDQPLPVLVNVTQEWLGRAVSVLCIHPHADGVDKPQPSMICRLSFSHSSDASLCHMHRQSSEFKVACTDLSNGLPAPDGCFQFIVPNAALGDDNKDYVEVKVGISID